MNNAKRIDELLELAHMLDDTRAPVPVRISIVKRRIGEMCKALLDADANQPPAVPASPAP